MKRIFNPIQLFVSVLFLGGVLGFTSCSDDDDPALPEVTTEAMFGSYTGTMETHAVVAHSEGEEAPAGVAVEATVNNDTIYFDQFPIRDIVLSIIGDEEQTDQIVAALGDIRYKVGYAPALTEEKDRITFDMDPKPLTLQVPTGIEEGQMLQIEVKVAAVDGAAYTLESQQLNFSFGATEVLLGEGETQVALPGFQPLTFEFQFQKQK